MSREGLVNEAISGMDLTRVIIAHRPETIASADRILIMKEGQIASVSSATDLREELSS